MKRSLPPEHHQKSGPIIRREIRAVDPLVRDAGGRDANQVARARSEFCKDLIFWLMGAQMQVENPKGSATKHGPYLSKPETIWIEVCRMSFGSEGSVTGEPLEQFRAQIWEEHHAEEEKPDRGEGTQDPA